MIIALWIATGLLALAMLAAGIGKLAQSKEKLAPRMPWVESFSATQVKGIGALEAIGALGLVLPQLTGVLPILTPLAAFALAALQVGAIVTHARRKEPVIVNIVLIALAVAVGVGWLLLG